MLISSLLLATVSAIYRQNSLPLGRFSFFSGSSAQLKGS